MQRTIRGAAIALLLLVFLTFSVLAAPQNPAQNSTGATTDGLTMLDEGAAAYYSPSYDGGGWDRIIGIHIHDGQYADDGTFPYSPDGYYCVRPGFDFGNVLTLQNPRTGKTIECTVADSVAPWDQAHWWAHFHVEISWAAFTALGLQQQNDVSLWVMPNS